MDYETVPPEKAYILLNSGGVVLVASASAAGQANLAPVAWVSPLDYEPVSKVLFVCDPGHRTLANIKETGCFGLALPTWLQVKLVEACGGRSGRDGDKFAALDIASFPARKLALRIPEGVAGWLECRLTEVIDRGTACIVCGEVVFARAVPEAWKLRLHIGGSGWYRPDPLPPAQTGPGAV